MMLIARCSPTGGGRRGVLEKSFMKWVLLLKALGAGEEDEEGEGCQHSTMAQYSHNGCGTRAPFLLCTRWFTLGSTVDVLALLLAIRSPWFGVISAGRGSTLRESTLIPAWCSSAAGLDT